MDKLIFRKIKVIPTEDETLKKIEAALAKRPLDDETCDFIVSESDKEGYSLLRRKVLYNRLEKDLSELFSIIDEDCEIVISEIEKGPLHIKYDIMYVELDENGNETRDDPEMIGEISFNIFYPERKTE